MSDGQSISEGESPEQDAGTERAGRGLSRRGLLGLIGAGAAGIAVGGTAGAVAATAVTRNADSSAEVHPFYGDHQGGITTPVQDHMHFAAFDMVEGATAADLRSLLEDWSYAAARMTQGLDVSASGAVGGSPQAPPDDTGEALGLPAAALTITFGFGPSLFEANGVDRFGIGRRRPAPLTTLPKFLGDDLDPLASNGDLCIQACADDPQVAVHAVRNLSRIAFGRAVLRWSQLGFGRTSKTSAAQSTPRNLFGFKDGTANILQTETDALAEHVWVGEGDGQAWLAGGSYLVARRIRQTIETWDRLRLVEQERTIGRDKSAGAPLSGGDEFAAPDFAATGDGSAPKIDVRSHVRLAHPDQNGGVRILRRGYNFVDGNDARGALEAGLFFLSYQRSPEQFITVQKALSTDLLGEYLRHVGSGIWAVPPGAREGSFVGAGLFA
ncbi:iron uptake transporter deferrochelatase/peroxidase subunit [Microbacterium sp. cx-55]|uniref:iron uptake transporter deferrochelatase/peroxidase subunit n=1 Tax=Microbacterium sp. cx-55 TaxID=2875948 RepID=UPI001CBC1238|nr:iron uptake transporter deferrochelatase/peroxidase subunit [Microbacterium sp. cx-55]MBZ4488584.1 deferrochelatase/peroxidase EfeB [Microbacterium sp. cx-55]UGB36164.1 iron uptake transporter deferrochelatase/peroxidase subunit [Microbacterium sp. cx-55]